MTNYQASELSEGKFLRCQGHRGWIDVSDRTSANVDGSFNIIGPVVCPTEGCGWTSDSQVVIDSPAPADPNAIKVFATEEVNSNDKLV